MRKFTSRVLSALMAGTMAISTMAAGITAFAADADTLKVAAISDIQYQADAADANGLILSRSGELLQAAIDQVNTVKPDVLLVTGDLTLDGSRDSHDYVAGVLANVDAGTKVLVVPGEKDVNKGGVNPTAITAEEFREIYAGFGYNEAEQDTSTLSYVADIKSGFQVLMLDSVAANGKGAINLNWATAQAEAKMDGDVMIAASHFPSVTRGSVDQMLIGLVYTIAGMKDANNANLYKGDVEADLISLGLVDRTCFSYSDAEALANAGIKDIFTGHSLMSNVMHETPMTDGETPTVIADWTDYNVGALVSAASGVRYATISAAADTTTTFEALQTIGTDNVADLTFAAMKDYIPTYVEEFIAAGEPVLMKVFDMVQAIGDEFVKSVHIGGLAGLIGDGAVQSSIKNFIHRIIEDLKAGTAFHDVIIEIRDALLATSIGSNNMTHVLADALTQQQRDNTQVCASLKPLVDELKNETPDPANPTPLTDTVIKDFASKLNGTKLYSLLDKVLDEQLQIIAKRSLREMLNGPVSFVGVSFDLWGTIDGLAVYNPDGSLVPDAYKPSNLYKPLVQAIFLNPTSASALTTAISDNASALSNLAKIWGIQYVI